ncbi:MAG: hypothetical protein ACQESE_02810 [Nanobdellota archaeon]
MAQTLITTMYGELHVHSLNVFDIGTNRTYIDHGRMSHDLTSGLSGQLKQLQSFLSEHEITSSIGMAIPGHVLDMIVEQDDVLLDQLSSVIANNNISILSMPYYAGSMHVLSGDELKAQVNHHNKTVAKHLGVTPSVFFTAEDHITPEHLRALAETGISSCIDSRALETDSSNTPQIITVDISAFDDPDTINKLDTQSLKGLDEISSSFDLNTISPASSTKVFSPMQEHIIGELKGLYPHVAETGDNELIADWRYLTHHKAVFHTDAAGELKHSQYDHYMDMMNIFNDIAHKIRSVELSKSGVFITEPEVADSPTQLLQQLSAKE